MTYEEAVQIAKRDEPTLEVIYGSEQEDQFLLVMGKNGSPLLNSSVYLVNKKTGKGEWVNTMKYFNKVNKPILREY